MGFVFVGLVLAVLAAQAVASPKFALAQDQEFYCMEFFDNFRQINYWAKREVNVSDYEYRSGDANHLNLTENVPNQFFDEPDQEIVTHFYQEFQKYMQSDLPFHDTEIGHEDRLDKALREFGAQDNFFEVFQAQEEARRSSLFGSHPGSVYCNVQIERRDFPVLYEMECRVVANVNLRNSGGLEEDKLGYSTPEHIMGEIKNSISRQFESLSQRLEVVRNCP